MNDLKGKWRYHFLIAFVIIAVDLFGDLVYRGPQGFIEGLGYQSILNNLALFIAFFSVYAINYAFISPNTLSQNRIFSFIISVFFLFIVFAGVRYFLDEIVIYNITGQHNYFSQSRRFWYYIFDNSYYGLKAILFSSSLYLLFQYFENKERYHQLQFEHKKAELNFLKTQLEPHFLFNTLNTFYTEIIDLQPSTAKDIHRLSELLRYVTYEAQQDFMPLAKEVKFIEDYIYFHKKRFEENLHLDYRLEGQIGDQEIPSLVLVHFVENIFKHGVIDQEASPAKISITISNRSLYILTENKVSSVEKHSTLGIGRENLQRRLSAIYKEQYVLEHEEKEEMYRTFLRIPLKITS